MFEKSGELVTGATDQGDLRAESLTNERPKETDETTRRLRMLPPELAAAVMRMLSSSFDANETRAQQGIEMATQIVNGMTLIEVHTAEAWQLHMRQCNALDALENYRNTREELRRAMKYLTRRCLRTIESQLAAGPISADVVEGTVKTLSAAG